MMNELNTIVMAYKYLLFIWSNIIYNKKLGQPLYLFIENTYFAFICEVIDSLIHIVQVMYSHTTFLWVLKNTW